MHTQIQCRTCNRYFMGNSTTQNQCGVCFTTNSRQSSSSLGVTTAGHIGNSSFSPPTARSSAALAAERAKTLSSTAGAAAKARDTRSGSFRKPLRRRKTSASVTPIAPTSIRLILVPMALPLGTIGATDYWQCTTCYEKFSDENKMLLHYPCPCICKTCLIDFKVPSAISAHYPCASANAATASSSMASTAAQPDRAHQCPTCFQIFYVSEAIDCPRCSRSRSG